MQITPEATAAFPLAAADEKTRIAWLSALPDALAFALGLAAARWAGWNAGDLIWSLWLSSFVVGYATILWVIGFPAVAFMILGWKTRHDSNSSPRQMLLLWVIALFGASFLLAFFT